jgi:hypothetical protein
VRHHLLLFLLIALLPSCAPKATREYAIATAYRYTQVEWMPEERHVRHGKDGRGIEVKTPDASIPRGWWKPGMPAKGMPYQWGGFDTPDSFLTKIAAGKKAGDIGDASKRKLGDAGTSMESCGIDCSGFVSRCWLLPRPYSTRELPSICDPLKSWSHLKPGDILLNHQHVLLFAGWLDGGKSVAAYEAGPIPMWRVNASGIPVSKLEREGYAPWRYRNIVE